jgi:hypothetical protein
MGEVVSRPFPFVFIPRDKARRAQSEASTRRGERHLANAICWAWRRESNKKTIKLLVDKLMTFKPGFV